MESKNALLADCKTFWLFREQPIEKGAILGLLKIFNETLDATGVISNQGKIVDVIFAESPHQRNTGEENKHIKETETAPEEWKVKPHKLAQKEIDARWTKETIILFKVIRTM